MNGSKVDKRVNSIVAAKIEISDHADAVQKNVVITIEA